MGMGKIHYTVSTVDVELQLQHELIAYLGQVVVQPSRPPPMNAVAL